MVALLFFFVYLHYIIKCVNGLFVKDMIDVQKGID